MNRTIGICLFFLAFFNLKSYAQEIAKVKPGVQDSFVVIISILDDNSDDVLNMILREIGRPNTGLKYLAYCNNQKSLILNANGSIYYKPLDVLKYLESKITTISINYKNIPIQDFYRTCNFSNPQEYRYFKLIYH